MTDSHVKPDRGTDNEGPRSVSTSLLDRLKVNSLESWRRLVYLFGPLVYQWCRQSGLQPADANDVGQDTFRAVADGICKFRRSRPEDTFRGWLWKIARNKIVDFHRRQRKEPQAVGGSLAQDRWEDLAAPKTQEIGIPSHLQTPGSVYHRALDLIRGQFEQHTWRAFWRVVVDGCKPAQVAEELGLSINSVYLAKSRILRRLRDELGDVID